MPELPEVETTLLGVKPHILNEKIVALAIRHHGLRWPIPKNIQAELVGQVIENVQRRGKYLLFTTAVGTIILHLGMSGSLRVLTTEQAAKKHDHVEIYFANHKSLRFTDPRRFGAFLWTTVDPHLHPLLAHLGPEPLEKAFTGKFLWQRAQKRKVPIKAFIMDSKIVVGVGNIYATEALFEARIHPLKAAGEVSEAQCVALVKAIKKTLNAAIKQGGTSLKDFVNSDGKKGYFSLHLKAYGRGGLPCVRCKTKLNEIRLGQRSTVFCPKCQQA